MEPDFNEIDVANYALVANRWMSKTDPSKAIGHIYAHIFETLASKANNNDIAEQFEMIAKRVVHTKVWSPLNSPSMIQHTAYLPAGVANENEWSMCEVEWLQVFVMMSVLTKLGIQRFWYKERFINPNYVVGTVLEWLKFKFPDAALFQLVIRDVERIHKNV